MIGLSLSFCIKDICCGIVHGEDVDYIISGILCQDQETWGKIMDSYCETYWRDFPELATDIATKFYREGRIDQPRLRKEIEPKINKGHWTI